MCDNFAFFLLLLQLLQLCVASNSTASHVGTTSAGTEGRPTFKRFQPRHLSSISDCGYYETTSIVTPTSTNSSEISTEISTEAITQSSVDVWAFIRNSPSYRRTYTCLRSTNVSEADYQRTSKGKKADLPFKIETAQLRKMTSARLTFLVNNFGNMTEIELYNDNQQAMYVVGSMLNSPLVSRYIPWMSRGSNPNEVNFNPTEILRKAAAVVTIRPIDVDATGEENDDLVEDDFTTVVFTVRRECENSTAICPSIFNTTIHMPSLRIFYV